MSVPRMLAGNLRMEKRSESIKKKGLLAARGREEELVDQQVGEAGGVVADDAAFIQEIVRDQPDMHFRYIGGIHQHGFGALGAIAAGDFRRDLLFISDDVVDKAMADVVFDGAQMLAE